MLQARKIVYYVFVLVQDILFVCSGGEFGKVEVLYVDKMKIGSYICSSITRLYNNQYY